MITAQEEETLIESLKSLSEMELTSVLGGISEHIYRNGLGEAVRISLGVESLLSEILNLEDALETARDEKWEYKHRCERAVDYLEGMKETLENIKMEELQKEVKRIIEMLSGE